MVGIKHESMRKGQTSHKKEHNTRMCFPLKPVFTRNKGGLPNFMDEPTSGLDPVSRDELMELFRGVVKSGERSILFSTHITSDLEKCASHITMIKDGQILCSDTRDGFLARYRAQFGDGQMSLEDILVRVERRSYDSEDFL